MNEYTVNNFVELHEVLSRYRTDIRWLFRGQSNPIWPLLPKAGRPEFRRCNDMDVFKSWKRRAFEFVSIPLANNWDWLAIAQHHGLMTRLLDWTYNPLAAAFFAVSENLNADAHIFAYRYTNPINTEEVSDPFSFSGVGLFKPFGVAPRIVRQSGVFTIHSEPHLLMEEGISEDDELEKVIIRGSYRRKLLSELSHYGVNKATLFPDLDGLSAYTNWLVSVSDKNETEVNVITAGKTLEDNIDLRRRAVSTPY